MDWPDFVEKNKTVLSDNFGWEREFVNKVLSRVPTLRPENVVCQFPFKDRDGRNRRIDFAIIEGEHVRIAIEVDGYDKTGQGTGMSRRDMEDFSSRQNALIQQGWNVLRFQNSQFLRQPNACIKDIGRTLLLARRNAIDLTSNVSHRVPQQISTAQSSSPSPKWIWSLCTVVVLALVVLLIVFTGENTQRIEPAATLAAVPKSAPAKAVEPNVSATAVPILSVTQVVKNTKILATEARNYIGEDQIVCGQVSEVVWAANKEDRPTYLNYGAAYPKNVFSAKISFSVAQLVRDKLGGYPQEVFQDKQVCVSGPVQEVYGKPQVIVEKISQLSLNE